MAGYIAPTILWHLLHTGAANAATLARVIGRPRETVNRAVRRLLAYGLVAKRPNTPRLLELTVKGIDAARAVDVSEIEQANEPATAPAAAVQPTEPAAVEQAAEPALIVQPPRTNLMTATTYRPDPGPALRPGALDYKRVATVGLRC
jgi:hypothetical protein